MEKGQSGRRHGHPRERRSPIGASPGTLIADPRAKQSALSLTLISQDGTETIADASIDDLLTKCPDAPLIWLDCIGLANVDLIADIGKIFKLHPLALEDVVNTGQRPKTEFFEDHAFVVLSMIDDAKMRRYEQIAIFFGANFVITFQERKGDPFNPVRKRIEAPPPSRIRMRRADYLAYALIDAIVDSYFPPVDAIVDSYFPPVDATGAAIDAIEDEMLAGPQKHQVGQLHELRRGNNVLKRTLWPVRDALAGLIRSEVSYIEPETKVYLNDTLDHAIRLIEIAETQRDMMTGLIEMHLSLSQARINDVISFLTIVSAIFIPLTFLVGIWGMNFDPSTSPWNMPELQTRYGYPLSLAFMAAIAIGLIAYFRWKKWL